MDWNKVEINYKYLINLIIIFNYENWNKLITKKKLFRFVKLKGEKNDEKHELKKTNENKKILPSQLRNTLYVEELQLLNPKLK